MGIWHTLHFFKYLFTQTSHRKGFKMKHVANDHALSAMQEIATCEKLFLPNFISHFEQPASHKRYTWISLLQRHNRMRFFTGNVGYALHNLRITKFCNKVEAWKEKKGSGRPLKISGVERRRLTQLALRNPTFSTNNIAEIFCEKTGISVHGSNVHRSLKTSGITKKLPKIVPCAKNHISGYASFCPKNAKISKKWD